MSPIEQLLEEQGDEVAARIASKLGIPLEEAVKILPAAASVVMARFDPASREGEARGANSLEGVLEGTGEQVSARLGSRFGLSPDQAAALVPIVLPVVLRFLVRRVPFGGTGLMLLTKAVKMGGYGSLDEIAARLARSAASAVTPSDLPAPSLATRLGRLAGKYFPSDRD